MCELEATIAAHNHPVDYEEKGNNRGQSEWALTAER